MLSKKKFQGISIMGTFLKDSLEKEIIRGPFMAKIEILLLSFKCENLV